MTDHSLIDLDALRSDLRLASGYAARAGLLRDPALLGRLAAAEQDAREPDVRALTQALNEAAQAIAPMTLADLRFGRDPFEQRNQRRARGLQLCLAIAALAVMLMIGHSMQSLRIEKAGLAAMEQLQALQPTQKSIALRKMAQLDDPLAKPSSAADLYRQKMAEWVAMYQTRQLLDTQIFEARNTSMFPFSGALEAVYAGLRGNGVGSAASAEVGAAPADHPVAAALPADESAELCSRDASGALLLPAADAKRPGWMKNLSRDFIEDFCFRNEVLRPVTGDAYALLQDVGRGSFVPAIESKVSMRSDWFLPFWFGCLGAIIFVMRNIASVRTPAMELFPMLMRISLGGVAGIVTGWFSSAALPAFTSTNALSVPFALAFLTGYAIDSLFGVLDRMSRVAGAGGPPKAPDDAPVVRTRGG